MRFIEDWRPLTLLEIKLKSIICIVKTNENNNKIINTKTSIQIFCQIIAIREKSVFDKKYMKNNINMTIKGTWQQFHDCFVTHKN